MHLRPAVTAALMTAALSLPLTAAAHAKPGGADKDCSDFDTQLEAQLVLDENPLDFFKLDADEDKIACEELPGTKIDASTLPTEVATPNAPSTAVPTMAPTTLPTTASPTETALPLPPATRRPSGPPPAGVGSTAAGPSDVLLPLGLALTTLAVGGGVVIIARRRTDTRPDA